MNEINTYSIASAQARTSTQGIRYSMAGAGRPVILTHGIAASRYDWEAILPAMAEAGYQAYAPDLLGHGDSHKPEDPRAYTIETLYEAFEAWIGALKLDLPALLVGHSLGGYLSLLYARRNQDKVSGLALIDPLYSARQFSPLIHLIRHKPDWGAKIVRKLQGWLGELDASKQPDSMEDAGAQARRQMTNAFHRASPFFVHIAREIPDLTSDLHTIETPALVIWGSRDFTLNPRSFPAMMQHLPNTCGRQIPGCGHQPHIMFPQVISRELLDFFSSLTHPVDSESNAN